MNNNTAGKQVKNLKAFLTWAFHAGLHDRQDYRRFKVIKQDVEVVYLTRAELKAIYNVDLSQTKHLEAVRDVFLFGCETGLRFSDIQKLRPEDIKEHMLVLRTKKTDDLLRIPLSPLAIQILKKHTERGLKALPVISNQKTNEHLKELCKLAGLTEITDTSRKKGSQVVEALKPKHEMITTHTARRTFVTLSLESGVRPEIVMRITGHKDYKTMKRYLKITDSVVEVEMKRIWNTTDPMLKAV